MNWYNILVGWMMGVANLVPGGQLLLHCNIFDLFI